MRAILEARLAPPLTELPRLRIEFKEAAYSDGLSAKSGHRVSVKLGRFNQRVFSRGVLRRIAIIRIAQSSGVSLAEIKAALEPIPHDRKASAKEWETVSKVWASSLKQRIAQLTQLSESLEGCIGCGCLTMGECPLLNPEDALGEAKSGPILFERTLHEKSLLS